MAKLASQIKELLPNGLGSKGDEERNPLLYPARPLHVLVATSGSVASIKLPLIVREILKVRPPRSAVRDMPF
jgi:phosphopantothenoylcysteine decarboxylase